MLSKVFEGKRVYDTELRRSEVAPEPFDSPENTTRLEIPGQSSCALQGCREGGSANNEVTEDKYVRVQNTVPKNKEGEKSKINKKKWK